MPLFRLAHISDPHLPPPDGDLRLGDILSKRTLSRLAWRRKQRFHDPAVLAALVADVKSHGVDHLAITGDLTNFATTAEFERARAWLDGLGGAAEVTVSPGNHDALVRRDGEPGLGALAPWFGDEGEATFPRLRRRGPVAVVNLSTAVATQPLVATGRLGDDQLARLDRMLADLATSGLCRILLLHHPPLTGVVPGRKSLTDAPELRRLLARHGAELVLHGHAHEAAFGALEGPDGSIIPVIGCPSASATPGGGHPASRWHMIELDPERPRGGLRVVARTYAGGGFAEAGRYLLSASGPGIAA